MAKNLYAVTLKTDDRGQLADIIDGIAGKGVTVEISVIVPFKPEPAAKPSRPSPLERKPRKMRGSKVNQAILAEMVGGPASIPALKHALERAGMAPGSLSTGIAALTKSGQIERVGEGLYGLKTAKAAE